MQPAIKIGRPNPIHTLCRKKIPTFRVQSLRKFGTQRMYLSAVHLQRKEQSVLCLRNYISAVYMLGFASVSFWSLSDHLLSCAITVDQKQDLSAIMNLIAKLEII